MSCQPLQTLKISLSFSKLISFYLESSVHGLNLTVPEDAKEVIKPWDEREDNSKYLDSSVDDQVCLYLSRNSHSLLICSFKAYYPRPVLAKCED